MRQAQERQLEQLYRCHAAAVHAYALRRADRATADEVVAETFVVAWRRLEQVPGEPLPWLYGVARRVLANQTRGAKRRRALASRLAAQPPDTAEVSQVQAAGDSPPLHADCSDGVLDRLRALNARDREVLLLVAWEGLTQTQAAEALGCSHAAVRVRLHRARRRLRTLIEESEAVSQTSGREVECDGHA